MCRWYNSEHGYRLDKGHPWIWMFILYAADTSKPRVQHSTGSFEKALCSRLAHDVDCLNRKGAGGECPSNGSPHFAYVAVRDNVRLENMIT